jgi:two-component system nitrate/nitrite response regulator NarL
MIRVAVIDDDRMLTESLRGWFAGAADLHLVAVAATVDELCAVADVGLDVVVLDLRLKDGSDPAENIARLRRAGPRVLVASVWDDPDSVAGALAAGAAGYLTKDHDLSALGAAIRDIAAGATFCSPEEAFALLSEPARPRLSGQERAVLLAYASGMTLKAAARHLGISLDTAKTYLARVKAKYGDAGRPTYTKLDLADRVREDGIHGRGRRLDPGTQGAPEAHR